MDGELIEAGDYSGSERRRARARQPGVQLAVTETARGGILLRGIGVRHNDVSVVTNVSADHLGLQGIDTLDQLAEVKAVVPRITKPTRLGGAQRRRPAGASPCGRSSSARPWVFSPRPGLAVVAGGARPGRPRDDRDRRLDLRARARRRSRSARARGRRADDAGRAEPVQRGERAGRRLGRAGCRAAARGGGRGADVVRARAGAQPRPDEHLLAARRRP